MSVGLFFTGLILEIDVEAFVLMGRSALDWLFFRDVGVVDLFTGDEIDLVGAGPSMLGLGCREADLLNGLLVL